MADFYDGNSIYKSIHTPDGIEAGWLQVSGVGAVNTPDTDIKYWKIESGEIVEMTAEEKDVIDNPPPPPKSADDYFNAIMAGLSPQEQIDFLDVYDEFPSFSLLLRHGNVEGAISRIDAAETAGMLSEAQADKIKGLMNGT